MPASDTPPDVGKGLPSSANSPGGYYFDGMPGRVLGAGTNTPSPNDGTYRSVTAVYRSKNRENALSQSRKRSMHKQEPPGKQSTSAAASRLERDKNERAAWANRAGAGRPPPRNGSLRHSPSPAESARSPDAVQRSGRGVGGNRDLRESKRSENSRKVTKSANLAGQGDDNGGTKGGGGGPYKGDPVARAFERYALHHDREEGLRRPPPGKLKASTGRSPPHGGGRWTIPPKKLSSTRNDTEGREDTARSPPRRQHRSLARQQLRWTDNLDDKYHLETRDEEGRDYDSPKEGHVSFRRQLQPHGVSRSLHGHTWPWVNGGDEGGGGRGGTISTNHNEKPARSRSRSWGNGARNVGRSPEREHSEFDGIGGEEHPKDGEEKVGPEGQRALRRAFDMYDVNGDGFITHLEVIVFLRRTARYTRVPPLLLCPTFSRVCS